jgi:prepilin-type N-terminal cleavage/methylation domain-containing protein
MPGCSVTCNSMKCLIKHEETSRRSNGFTLVELLVVIAIIGILAALLIPVITHAKSYARSITCKNHLRQMGLALQMYVDEYNRYPYLRA